MDTLIRTARAFKHHRAISFDNLKPHIIADLSDEALKEVLELFHRAEREGRWSRQWITIMVMKPTPKQGDYRCTAMLNTMYGI